MSKAYFEQDINKRVSELDSMEDVLCIGNLSLAAFSSSARSSMLTQHLVQALTPDNPEIPGVLTGYEYMYGKYSNSFKMTDSKYKVIKRIDKYPGWVYTLLLYDKEHNKYDIVERRDVKCKAESYGFTYNNTVIDSYKPGDLIPKNTVIYKAPTIDDNMNFMYGVNAKVVYVNSQETIEDAIVISKSFAKKLSTTKVEVCDIMFNENDIPLNLYGNNEIYKAFPDIGEKTKKCILCGIRRRNKNFDQWSLKNKNLRKRFANDTLIQLIGNYTVVDINIWSNKAYDDIPDLPVYEQIKKYLKYNIDYYQNIYDTFGEIIESKTTRYSKEFSRLYAKARDYLDPNTKYVEDDRMFSNIMMEFTVKKSCPLTRGCKLCGRFGNKSVISKILPDDEMGVTEDGIIPDVRMDMLGVLGRLNSGQCIEQELNWVAALIRNKMKEMTSLSDQFHILYKFFKIVNEDQLIELKRYVGEMSQKEKEKFIEDILNDRIYIIQSPMYCITGDKLRQLYEEFKPKKSVMYYKDDYGNKYPALREIIVADEYLLRLKQEPDTKFSVRSKGLTNPRTFVPIKSTRASKHKILYSDQCNRIGEQELPILMLSNDSDAIDYFYRSHATSIAGRRSDTLFTQDSSHGFIINMPSNNSRAVDMLNAYLKSIGYRIDIEYKKENHEKAVDAQFNTPKIPHYIKDLFDDDKK